MHNTAIRLKSVRSFITDTVISCTQGYRASMILRRVFMHNSFVHFIPLHIMPCCSEWPWYKGSAIAYTASAMNWAVIYFHYDSLVECNAFKHEYACFCLSRYWKLWLEKRNQYSIFHDNSKKKWISLHVEKNVSF